MLDNSEYEIIDKKNSIIKLIDEEINKKKKIY